MNDTKWKLDVGGFIALDAIKDSTQGIGEVIGNGPVARPGSSGDRGRLQVSAKHSRIHLTLLPPIEDGWRSKGYLEGDFLGSSGAISSEQSFYSNGNFRIRHAYFNLEKDGWKFLVGQTSILFGFVPTYLLATVSVIPGPAQIYQRTPQLQAGKTIAISENQELEVTAAVTRPTQSESELPNLDLATRWKHRGRLGRMNLMSGESRLEPTSVALSGTFREFRTANPTTLETSQTSGAALAINFLFPIIASNDLSETQGLTFTASFTTGKGYADLLSGWSGNLSRFPQNTNDPTRLDAGEGGYDAAGVFNLVPIHTWNAQLQYHFASHHPTWMTAGVGKLWASDVANLGPVVTGRTLYNDVSFYFINLARDLTSQIRLAIEYSPKAVKYVDDVSARNDRYQLMALYRF